MANITITRGTTLPDSSAKSDFHGLVDNASAAISSIENADISNSAAIAASKLNLATIAQDMAMSGKVINFAKGSDIASATTTDIGAATGNFVDVTGTTTITGLGTVQAGTIRFVRFTGILTLTHNGTSLILPTTANITTAANDRAIFASLGSGNWICLSYQRADGTSLGSAYTPTTSNALSGSVIQTVNTQITTPVNVTAVVPQDDTNPLYSEGNALGSLAITPTNASNLILVRMSGWGTPDGNQICTFWMNDATGSDPALAVRQILPGGSNGGDFSIEYCAAAGGTSEITFYLVAGVASGTFYFGRSGAGSDLFGTASFGSITIQEIKA